MNINDLEIEEAERNFPKHFSYKGKKFEKMEDALRVFLLDRNKNPYSGGVTYHTRNEGYGIELTGVDQNGNPWYSQLSEHMTRPEIREGLKTFKKLSSMNIHDLEIEEAERNFPKHFSYKGEKFEKMEDALRKFLLEENKQPNEAGVIYHTRNEGYGIELTGVDQNGNPWYTKLSDHMIRPEIKEGINTFEKLQAELPQLKEGLKTYQSMIGKHVSNTVLNTINVVENIKKNINSIRNNFNNDTSNKLKM